MLGKEQLKVVALSKQELMIYSPEATDAMITVYSVNGQVVEHLTSDLVEGLSTFNLSKLTIGTYIIEVKTSETTIQKKFLVY